MDNIIHTHENNPDLIGMDKPSASDVADNIMNNQVSDYDISDLMDDATQAECFRELIGIWASREDADYAHTDIIDFMELSLKAAAKRKGYQS